MLASAPTADRADDGGRPLKKRSHLLSARVAVELLDARVPVAVATAIVTLAEATRRRRHNVVSSPTVDGTVTWNKTITSDSLPTSCWVDLWDASLANSPDGFLGKVQIPLATTRVNVPHFVQGNLLHGGIARVRITLRRIADDGDAPTELDGRR